MEKKACGKTTSYVVFVVFVVVVVVVMVTHRSEVI